MNDIKRVKVTHTYTELGHKIMTEIGLDPVPTRIFYINLCPKHIQAQRDFGNEVEVFDMFKPLLCEYCDDEEE